MITADKQWHLFRWSGWLRASRGFYKDGHSQVPRERGRVGVKQNERATLSASFGSDRTRKVVGQRTHHHCIMSAISMQVLDIICKTRKKKEEETLKAYTIGN